MCEGKYKFYRPKKVCNSLIIIVLKELFAMRYFEKVRIIRMIKEHTLISKIESCHPSHVCVMRNGYAVQRKLKFEINYRVTNYLG